LVDTVGRMIGYIAHQNKGKKTTQKQQTTGIPRPHCSDCVAFQSTRTPVQAGAGGQLGKNLRTKERKQHGPGRKDGVGVKTTCIKYFMNRKHKKQSEEKRGRNRSKEQRARRGERKLQRWNFFSCAFGPRLRKVIQIS
jgi:hypothetical protein